MVLVVVLVFNSPLPQSHSLFFNYTNLNLEFHSSINSHYICANLWFWIFEFDHTFITDKINLLHQRKDNINVSRQSRMGPQKKLWIIFLYQTLVGYVSKKKKKPLVGSRK